MASNTKSIEPQTPAKAPKAKRDLFVTEHINRLWAEVLSLKKAERLQYRTDIKAVMCRGVAEDEVTTIKQGLWIEKGGFALSRLYVPVSIAHLYRRGVFQEAFTFGEFKYIFRVFLFMHCIDMAGHLAMKYYTKQVHDQHVGINDDMMTQNRKIMSDYII